MCSVHTKTVINQTIYKILSRLSAILTTLLFLQGCTMVGPNYEVPAVHTPDAWTEKISQQVNKRPQAALQTWWMVFDDPKLDDLIERSRKENIDLKIAVSRIRESRAMLAIANGGKLPQVNASGEASRTEPSDNGILAPIESLGGVSSRR